MNKFAAIIDHSDIGQVLIVRSQNMDNKPQVSVQFMVEDMKVGPEYSWDADEDGIKSRDDFWNNIQNDPEYIEKYVLPIYNSIKEQVKLVNTTQDKDDPVH